MQPKDKHRHQEDVKHHGQQEDVLHKCSPTSIALGIHVNQQLNMVDQADCSSQLEEVHNEKPEASLVTPWEAAIHQKQLERCPVPDFTQQRRSTDSIISGSLANINKGYKLTRIKTSRLVGEDVRSLKKSPPEIPTHQVDDEEQARGEAQPNNDQAAKDSAQASNEKPSLLQCKNVRSETVDKVEDSPQELLGNVALHKPAAQQEEIVVLAVHQLLPEQEHIDLSAGSFLQCVTTRAGQESATPKLNDHKVTKTILTAAALVVCNDRMARGGMGDGLDNSPVIKVATWDLESCQSLTP